MKPQRCCLCWQAKKQYREVISPMKEKHAVNCEKLLSVNMRMDGRNLHFCFPCFDTVARLSLITDRLEEIKNLMNRYTSTLSKHIKSSRQSLQDVTKDVSTFKNIAEKIVTTHNGQQKLDDALDHSYFENSVITSCLENFEYDPSLKVPKGIHRAEYFQQNSPKEEKFQKSSSQKEPLVKLTKLKLKSGKTHGIYYCQECNKEVKNKSGFTFHNLYNTRHGNLPYPLTVKTSTELNDSITKRVSLTKVNSSNETTVECDLCHKRLESKYELFRHRKLVHLGASYKCKLCTTSFTQRSRLSIHIKVVHTKEISFECRICRKHFANSRNLRVHEKLHSFNNNEKINANFATVSSSLAQPKIEENNLATTTHLSESESTTTQL